MSDMPKCAFLKSLHILEKILSQKILGGRAGQLNSSRVWLRSLMIFEVPKYMQILVHLHQETRFSTIMQDTANTVQHSKQLKLLEPRVNATSIKPAAQHDVQFPHSLLLVPAIQVVQAIYPTTFSIKFTIATNARGILARLPPIHSTWWHWCCWWPGRGTRTSHCPNHNMSILIHVPAFHIRFQETSCWIFLLEISLPLLWDVSHLDFMGKESKRPLSFLLGPPKESDNLLLKWDPPISTHRYSGIPWYRVPQNYH